MTDLINFVATHKTEIIAIIGSVVTAASIIVRLTPTEVDNKVFEKVVAVLRALSLAPKEDKTAGK